MKNIYVLTLLVVAHITSFATPLHAGSGIKEITDEIHTLNLINGLYLSAGQRESLVKAARELSDGDEKAQKEIKKLEKTSLVLLKELRDTLSRRAVIGKELKEKVRKNAASVKNIKDKHELNRRAAAAKVRGILNDSQLEVIRNYRPCLIPPEKDGKIGQADFGDHFSNILEKAKKIPDSKFWERKEEIIDKLVEKYKNTAPRREDVDWDKLKRELGAVLDEIRELKDSDFMGLFDKYVEDLKELLPQADGAPVEKKIEKYLLSETAAGLLAGSLKK